MDFFFFLMFRKFENVKFQGNCVILSEILPELVSLVYEWVSFLGKLVLYMGLPPNFQWHIFTKTKFECPPPRLLYSKFYCSAHAKHTVFVLLSSDERQLRVFVELAMNSAGEEAFELDKVTCFHRAVTGYAAFIFELKEDAGYKDLLEVSKKVWNALDNDKHLSKELVRCGYTVVVVICDPSHQNRAVVGRMHFKILLHLYGKKQRK